jgi:ADP-heptose:LPS heptosyltransferase
MEVRPADTHTSLHERRRIAVVRMLPGLGDLLCCVPALRAVKTAEPTAHVTFIGLPSGAWLAERFPEYIDDWLSCSSCPGLPESEPDTAAYRRFLTVARSARFDLAVQMHGDGRVTNSFTRSLGASRWGGLCRPGTDDATGSLVDVPTGRHEIDRCGDALEAVGIPMADPRLEFPVHDSDRTQLESVLGPLAGSWAVVHPGASRSDRCWSEGSFAAIADHLADRVDHVVLTGSASEAGRIAAVRARTASQPVDTVGRTSLGAMAALLERARVVVCNDTGVAHLAGAVGTPSVTVSARSDRARWSVRGPRHWGVDGPHGDWPGVDPVAARVDAALAGPPR